jgi:hypothetical protein
MNLRLAAAGAALAARGRLRQRSRRPRRLRPRRGLRPLPAPSASSRRRAPTPPTPGRSRPRLLQNAAAREMQARGYVPAEHSGPRDQLPWPARGARGHPVRVPRQVVRPDLGLPRLGRLTLGRMGRHRGHHTALQRRHAGHGRHRPRAAADGVPGHSCRPTSRTARCCATGSSPSTTLVTDLSLERSRSSRASRRRPRRRKASSRIPRGQIGARHPLLRRTQPCLPFVPA